jgi:transposase
MDIDLNRIPKAEEVSSLEQAREVITQLIGLVKVLQTCVEALEAKLAKNSRNSHKPPSSDGYDKPQPKSRRKKSHRRPGGQRGHKGHTLSQVDTPDERRRYVLSRCPLCGCSLKHISAHGHERRQVFDVVPAKRHVIEYQAEIKQCPYCQRSVKAAFPEGVEHPVQYGAQLEALVSYYSQYQLLPYQRIQELFQDVMNVPLSQGSIATKLDRSYGQLEGFEANIKAQLIASPVVNFDESGMRVNNAGHWLHVASTSTLTYYYIHPKRGIEAMDEIGILPQFTGCAIHDHWAAYYRFGCQHGLCNAHHLRELIYVEEQYNQRWAARLQACLLQAKEEVEEAKRRGWRSLSRDRIAYHQRRYSRILRQGAEELPVLEPPPTPPKRGRPKQHRAKNLHDRLKQHKYEALAFIYDFSVPFDNNLGERDIRMTKVKQKISGCFRSARGASSFARIRSYISTAKKQGKNVLGSLVAAFQGQPLLPENH